MQHVFISYVRENSEIVDKLCETLESHGIKVWLDRNDIDPGVFWEQAIRDAIEKGAFFIACFSKEYYERGRTYMNEELNLAIAQLRLLPMDQVWFIPVKLNECPIPKNRITVGKTLQSFQHVELFENWNTGIQGILKSIHSNSILDRAGDFASSTDSLEGVTDSKMYKKITALSELLATPCPILDPKQPDKNRKEFNAWYDHPLWQVPARLPEHKISADYTKWDVYQAWWSSIGWHRDRGHKLARRQERLQDIRANLNLIKSLPVREDWGALYEKALGYWEPEVPAHPNAPHYDYGVLIPRYEIQRDVYADLEWYDDHQETMYPFEIERAMLIRFDEERCAALAWQIAELKNAASASDYKELQMHVRNDFDLPYKDEYPKWYKDHIRKYREHCRIWWESIGKAAYNQWLEEEVMVHGYTEQQKMEK